MRKGVTAMQNLRTLRRCQQHGVRLIWNLLCGFPERWPAGFLRHVYPDLTEPTLAELTYLFDTPPQGIDQVLARDLEAAVTRWQAAHRRAYLVLSPGADRDVITDGRGRLRVRQLTDPDERRLFRIALDGTSVAALRREHPDADGFVARWESTRLVHRDEDRLVALPLVGR